jgi:putative SOS response-associated peptidase YedK
MVAFHSNTRNDQVRTNKFWTDSLEKRRCLVPATSFCEPHGSMP